MNFGHTPYHHLAAFNYRITAPTVRAYMDDRM